MNPLTGSFDPSPFTVVIADDHDVVRDGIRTLLQRSGGEFKVVGEADDVQSTLDTVREHQPDLLILDVSMPGGPSLSALPTLFEEHRDMKVVVLTMHEDPAYASEALNAGAHGYVVKEAEPTDLMQGFRNAVTGKSYVHPRVEALMPQSEPDDPDPRTLNEREREVVRLVALGHTNAQVAERLHIAERAVKTYRDRIGVKLGVASRTELAGYARRVGQIASAD